MSKKQPGCLPEGQLSAYLDGETAVPGQAAAIRSHLQQCAACRRAYEELQALKDGLRELGGAEPAPDCWPRILRRREQERRPTLAGRLWGGGRWPALALTGVAAAVVALVLFQRPAQVEPDKTGALIKAYASVIEAEQTYVRAIDALQRVVAERSRTLDPPLQRTIGQGLAQIDLSIRRLRQELRKAPHDFQARRALLAAYQRKVDYLNELIDPSI